MRVVAQATNRDRWREEGSNQQGIWRPAINTQECVYLVVFWWLQWPAGGAGVWGLSAGANKRSVRWFAKTIDPSTRPLHPPRGGARVCVCVVCALALWRGRLVHLFTCFLFRAWPRPQPSWPPRARPPQPWTPTWRACTHRRRQRRQRQRRRRSGSAPTQQQSSQPCAS